MESGPARSAKEEAVGLPSPSVSGVDSQNIPAGVGFPPNGCKGNFREQQHMGRKPTPQSVGKPRAKTNNDEATTQMVNQDTVLPVLEALGLLCELLEEIKKRLPPVKLPEKKKERALADLRDKLDKEKKRKDWRATLRKSDKRQKRLCRSMLSNNMR